MALLKGFHDAGEITADERGRLSFGKKVKIGSRSRYAIAISDDGVVMLTPMVSIPARELDIWNDPETRAAVTRGLADVAAGRTRRIDDLLDDEDDDE